MTALYSIDELRAAHAAGHRIQANRGTDGARRWVDLTNPEFTCPAHLYRIAPAAAMTDHKAEWVLVPRVATPEMLRAGFLTGSNELHVDQPADAPGLVWAAMLAAAPAASEGGDLHRHLLDMLGVDTHEAAGAEIGRLHAAGLAASEGEDGAVGEVERIDAALFSQAADEYGDDMAMLIDFMGMGSPETLDKARNIMRAAIRAYTRPAAQVAATPKHDEGREAVEAALLDMADAAAKADSSNCTPIQSREQWARYDAAEKIVRRALATQPAARGVTDEALCDALKAYNRAANRWDKLDLDSRDEPRSLVAMRAALESFARPAEGVRS